jgi:hypothetical protein
MDSKCASTQPTPQMSGLAIASLILSCLTIFLGPFGCVPGIVCGHIARWQIRRDPNSCGGGVALAGLIIGYIFLVFGILGAGAIFFMRMSAVHVHQL